MEKFAAKTRKPQISRRGTPLPSRWSANPPSREQRSELRHILRPTVRPDTTPASPEPAAESQRQQIRAILGRGQPLPSPLRDFFAPRLGRNLDPVRLHTSPGASEAAQSLHAAAFTLDQDIAFAEGRYQPETSPGLRLLAHELAHTVQPGAGARIMASLDDPSRYSTIHSNLFTPAQPATAPAAATPTETEGETPAPAGGQTTAVSIESQFRARLATETPTGRPAEAVVDSSTIQGWAINDAYPRLQSAFPQFSFPAPTTGQIAPFDPRATFPRDVILSAIEQFLHSWTDIDRPQHRTALANIQTLETQLANDSQVSSNVQAILSQRSAFTRVTNAGTQQETRTIHISRGGQRMSLDEMLQYGREGRSFSEHYRARICGTLIHELAHFYVNNTFPRWLERSNAPLDLGEGFAEFLARRAMNSDELATRSFMDARVTRIENQVAQFVSVDDIARAFFNGEVWRLEGTTAIARERFAADVGLSEEQSRDEEVRASRSGPGIVSVVVAGQHYRFMNLGISQDSPKQQHIAYFTTLYQQLVSSDPNVRLRFIGYASDPGSERLNLALSERRAAAFYQMARDAGVPANQLLDADNPPHQGEASPTADNDTVRGRAFNRRVELQITRIGAEATE